MGIYSEKSIPRWAGVIILIAAFIAIYQPWLLGDRELFRLEGLYAVSATEFDPTGSPNCRWCGSSRAWSSCC